MNKRKREETNKRSQEKEEDDDLDEAIEARIDLDEEEKNASSEESGEDLMNNMDE